MAMALMALVPPVAQASLPSSASSTISSSASPSRRLPTRSPTWKEGVSALPSPMTISPSTGTSASTCRMASMAA